MGKLKFITPILLLTILVLIGGGCGNDENEENGEEKVEESRGGSCNSIEIDSICMDYIGSFWSADFCNPAEYYSENPCPPSSIGGCRFAPGAGNEYILLYYGYGGHPMQLDEEIRSAREICEASNGQWVGPSN